MIRFQILQCDTPQWIGFAKNRARSLIEANAGPFTKTYSMGDGTTIRMRSIRGYAGFIVKLWISGTSSRTNQLYNWPNMDSACAFSLSALPTDPVLLAQVDSNTRVLQPNSLLKPLNDVLSFSAKKIETKFTTSLVPKTYTDINSTAQMCNDFTSMLTKQQWIVRPMIIAIITKITVDRKPGDAGELQTPPIKPSPLTPKALAELSADDQAAYAAAVAYWTVTLPITWSDCFMSQPVNGDVRLVLGKFNNSATDALHQNFRGIHVPFSVLVSYNTMDTGGITVDLSQYNTTITPSDAALIHVFDTTEYQRKRAYDITTGTFGAGGTNHREALFLDYQIAESPFGVTYRYLLQIEDHSIASVGPGYSDYVNSTNSMERHTIDFNGVLSITLIDMTPYGSALHTHTESDAIAGTSITANAPYNNSIMIYDGETSFVKMGEIAWDGVESDYHLVYSVPDALFASMLNASPNPPIAQYIKEYGLFRMSISDFGAFVNLNNFTQSGDYTAVPKSLGFGIFPPTNGAGLLLDTDIYNIYTGSRNDSFYSVFDSAGQSMSFGYPLSAHSALPIIQPGTNGGVFWYDGDNTLGVCFFRCDPANLAQRASDCTTYQSMWLSLQTETDPLNKQHIQQVLDVLLTNIVANTQVLANNFASNYLLPWLTVGYVGIIL